MCTVVRSTDAVSSLGADEMSSKQDTAFVLFRAILWECAKQQSLPGLHYCICCPSLIAMASVIACRALIMPALLRRPQSVCKGGRARNAVRVHHLSMQLSHFRSLNTVAAQIRQQDAATPHQISEPGARAASIKHISSDRSEIDQYVDTKSSFSDLTNLWRRLADAAAAWAVITALVRRHA